MTNQAKPSQAKPQWIKLGLFANLLLPNFVFATTSPTSPPVNQDSLYTTVPSVGMWGGTRNLFSARENALKLLEQQSKNPMGSIQGIIAIIKQDIENQKRRLEANKVDENTPSRDQSYMYEQIKESKEIIDYLTELKAELEKELAILSQPTAQRATPA